MIATPNVQDVPRQKFVDYDAAKQFGRWIRKAREKRGIPQKQIADELGLTLSYWSRVEAGQRSIARREDFLNKLAALLNLDVNEVHRQASPTAKELSAEDALRQLESAASVLAAIRLPDKERERAFRYVGDSVLQWLKFARATAERIGTETRRSLDAILKTEAKAKSEKRGGR